MSGLKIIARESPIRDCGHLWTSQWQKTKSGGEGGIRTPDRGVSPYNGLANRRLQPLGHLSGGLRLGLLYQRTGIL